MLVCFAGIKISNFPKYFQRVYTIRAEKTNTFSRRNNANHDNNCPHFCFSLTKPIPYIYLNCYRIYYSFCFLLWECLIIRSCAADKSE